jgi:hypothetical protein
VALPPGLAPLPSPPPGAARLPPLARFAAPPLLGRAVSALSRVTDCPGVLTAPPPASDDAGPPPVDWPVGTGVLASVPASPPVPATGCTPSTV